jgi:hypothetical protein
MMFPKPLRRAKKREKVPEWLPAYIHARDNGCVPARLGAPDPCIPPMTLEHVRDRDKPAVGKKAPNDKWHLVSACLGHNTGWCLTSEAKDRERDYLLRVEGVA